MYDWMDIRGLPLEPSLAASQKNRLLTFVPRPLF